MSTQPVLSIRNLGKSFDDNVVLQDVSLDVEKGEVIAIIGPSGSGKSTLLRCATLLERADSGSIAYGDEVVCEAGSDGRSHYASRDALQRIRSRFGLVFQDFNLFPHYTALRNVSDALHVVTKWDKARAEERGRALLARMGLGDRADAYPHQLSGGQKQRVAMARAMAMDPSILFFDEPTSALDPELTQEVLRIIRELVAEHMTMVIVTHEIGFARSVADRVIFMADGVVIEEGDPARVIDAPDSERTRTFLRRLEAEA